MAYDEIRPCPDCGALAYDRCDCGWIRPEGSAWPFWCIILAVGIVAVAFKLAI